MPNRHRTYSVRIQHEPWIFFVWHHSTRVVKHFSRCSCNRQYCVIELRLSSPGVIFVPRKKLDLSVSFARGWCSNVSLAFFIFLLLEFLLTYLGEWTNREVNKIIHPQGPEVLPNVTVLSSFLRQFWLTRIILFCAFLAYVKLQSCIYNI